MKELRLIQNFHSKLRISMIVLITLILPKSVLSRPVAQEVFKTNDSVWGMAFLDTDELLLTERQGRMLRVNLKSRAQALIEGLPAIQPHGQGGLMDIQLHPHFSKTSLVYFSYSVMNRKDSWTTRISRAKLSGTKLTNVEVLFTADLDSNREQHFGSRMAFDRKGYIFFGVGDRGERDLAQSLSHYNGKIFRLHEDGKVPIDNPFVKTQGARPEIWAYGVRNPQGLTRHFLTGEIFENEHGPRGGDEINRILPGRNYGWPEVTFGREYWGPKIGVGTTKAGVESPLHQFTPSIAPSSLMIYSGKIFKDWKGNFFSGALALRHLNRLVINESGKVQTEERLFEDLNERIRYVAESPEGLIYFSTDSGKIYRLNRP